MYIQSLDYFVYLDNQNPKPMNEKDLTSRRSFIRTVTAAAVGAPLILDSVLASVPAKKLRHACIGVGVWVLMTYRTLNRILM